VIGIRNVAEIFYQDTNRERVNYYPEVVNFFNLYFKKNVLYSFNDYDRII